ncbi:GNAT family N-acetyltransferase [Undibacterium sp. TJN19]|uniref:GNAT family N-acetyltransferase n=1 Tax=Undibacterium sp. TJN19 TaxID=3413055 RepID=UPI003BF0F287
MATIRNLPTHGQFGYLNPLITLEQRLERLRLASENSLPLTLIALSDEGQVQGTASLNQSTLTHKHLSPWLSAIFVPPMYRGTGIASALATRARLEAARLGHQKIYLFTPHNASLYARLGWESFDTAQLADTTVTLMEASTAM